MLKISDIISNDKSISFNNFINELNNCIKIKDSNPNEIMFKYVNRIMSDAYILHSHKYYDNSVISYFKDWYIDGESRDIELPYGVTLEYREPEFVKKDIEEIETSIKNKISRINIEIIKETDISNMIE